MGALFALDPGFLAAVFVTLFVVIDPIGLAPIFVALTQGDWAGVVAVHLVMLAVVAICFVLFLAAGLIERGLGRIGALVVTRLLGMLLAALSVQFVLDGARALGLLA